MNLTDANFEIEIQKAKIPVLVDFWAEWCMPCSMIGPILEKLAGEYEDRITLAKVNLDEAPLTAKKYGIDRIPTVVLFKWGKPISGFLGVKPEGEIREWLEGNQQAIEQVKGKIEEMIKGFEEYAAKNGFRLNPDKKALEFLVAGLLANEKKHGARYCPCRRITGNKEEDKANICPCQWHKEEIKKDGRCCCGLFYK
jgi:thioredoxin 1